MRRALLLSVGIALVTYFEFAVFPGHSYLRGETQVYVPMLERLDAPGYLSRDLVATHPHLKYTIYDEVTLSLREIPGINFKTALVIQQLIWRAASVFGAFLLARAVGLSDLLSFLVAALLNLGATLAGPGVALVEREPLPYGFAVGLILLGMGLLARGKPLLAGLAGGLALLYDIPIAASFWLVIVLAAIFDRDLRPLFRPVLTSLFVFALLLANLAQLQPGVVESQAVFGKLPARVADLQRYWSSSAWVSLWAGKEIWSYLAIWLCGMWATARIWPILNRQMRWFLIALPLFGIVSIPVSFLFLEKLRWTLIPQIQPARELIFTAGMAVLTSSIAGVRAALERREWETFVWFFVVFAIPFQTRILDVLRVSSPAHLAELAFSLVLAGLSVYLLIQHQGRKAHRFVLIIPLLAMFAGATVCRLGNTRAIHENEIADVADWAEANTWGSSMFLFPDAGRDLYPGIFRGESRRALWVDWRSGSLLNFFESFANDWWDRWHETMQESFSPQRMERMLSLPVDYFVLRRSHELADVKPAFANREFVVYDSRDLRKASNPLRLASGALQKTSN
ncbi:MAG: hypothetical protein JOY62_05940 [Acidobacteriaceae bacterium]|nr:hypothetical protein [Acidobacteriaceae bacterium]MBV9779499.1 hypothetical protein [Acidobacteriaceae bacterium]